MLLDEADQGPTQGVDSILKLHTAQNKQDKNGDDLYACYVQEQLRGIIIQFPAFLLSSGPILVGY